MSLSQLAVDRVKLDLIARRELPPRKPATISLMGNSFAARGSFTGVIQNQFQDGPSTWMLAALEGKMKLVTSAGIGGQFTSDMVPRFQTDALANNPTLVVCNFLENDVHQGGYDENVSKANVLSMIDMAWRAGARCMIDTVVPVIPTGAGAVYYLSGQRPVHTYRMNEWLRSLPYLYPKYGVIICDAEKIAMDPLSATGAPLTTFNYIRTDDCIHENPILARAVGEERARLAIAALGLPDVDLLPKSVAHRYTYDTAIKQYFANPLFQGTGGTNSTSGTFVGSVPTEFTLQKTGTAGGTIAVTARADGFGNDVVITVNTGGNGDTVTLLSNNYTASSPAGDIVFAGGHVQWSGLAQIKGAQFSALYRSTALGSLRGSILEYPTNSIGAATYDGYTGYSQADFNKMLYTGPVARPADVTELRMEFKITLGGAAPAGVYKLGRAGLFVPEV